MSVVTVIELDDRSHERADRQYADARKNKALKDSGLRRVRIPAGTIPDQSTLIDLVRWPRSDAERLEERHSEAATQELQLAPDDWSSDPMIPIPGEETLRAILKPVVIAALLIVGGWMLYSLMLNAPADHATTQQEARSTPAAIAPPFVSTRATTVDTTRLLAERRAEEIRAASAAALLRQEASDVAAKTKEEA